MNRHEKEAVEIAERHSIRIDRMAEISTQIFKFLRKVDLSDAEFAYLLVIMAATATGTAMAKDIPIGFDLERLFEETVRFAIDEKLSGL